MERMKAGIYFPLFLVLVTKNWAQYAIYYLSADLQPLEMFKPQKSLPPTAKRAGFTGFVYDLAPVKNALVELRNRARMA